jgi:hypothetical protein
LSYLSIQRKFIYDEASSDAFMDQCGSLLNRHLTVRISSVIVGMTSAVYILLNRAFDALEELFCAVIVFEPKRFKYAGSQAFLALALPLPVAVIGGTGFFAPKTALWGMAKLDRLMSGYPLLNPEKLTKCSPFSASVLSPVRGLLWGAKELCLVPSDLIEGIFDNGFVSAWRGSISSLRKVVKYPYYGFTGVISKHARAELKL